MGRMEQIFWGEGIFLKHVEGGSERFSNIPSQVVSTYFPGYHCSLPYMVGSGHFHLF